MFCETPLAPLKYRLPVHSCTTVNPWKQQPQECLRVMPPPLVSCSSMPHAVISIGAPFLGTSWKNVLAAWRWTGRSMDAHRCSGWPSNRLPRSFEKPARRVRRGMEYSSNLMNHGKFTVLAHGIAQSAKRCCSKAINFHPVSVCRTRRRASASISRCSCIPTTSPAVRDFYNILWIDQRSI